MPTAEHILIGEARDLLRFRQSSRLEEPGEHAVDVPIVCVITRFGLRSARYLLPTYLDYRRVLAHAGQTRTPGLLRSAFLVENPGTCFSLSLWAGTEAIAHFGTSVPAHVEAARRGFGRVCLNEARRPEIWSTKWRLAAVSNNLYWEDFDLRGLILRMSA